MKDNKFTKRMSDKRRGIDLAIFHCCGNYICYNFAVKSSDNDTRQYKCVID